MLKKVAELKIKSSAYCTTEIIKALEKNGFKVIVEQKSSFEEYYIIAKEDESGNK